MHTHKHTESAFCGWDKIFDNLKGRKIYIPFMTKDVEYFFMDLLVICTSPFGNWHWDSITSLSEWQASRKHTTTNFGEDAGMGEGTLIHYWWEWN
jgi:hypothetical protein